MVPTSQCEVGQMFWWIVMLFWKEKEVLPVSDSAGKRLLWGKRKRYCGNSFHLSKGYMT